jgi:hypothetical protein
MQVNNESREVIMKLAAQVRDTSKPLAERRDALKHICELRNEPYQYVPDDDLSFVAGAMTFWPEGIKPPSLELVIEAMREGKLRRDMRTSRP